VSLLMQCSSSLVVICVSAVPICGTQITSQKKWSTKGFRLYFSSEILEIICKSYTVTARMLKIREISSTGYEFVLRKQAMRPSGYRPQSNVHSHVIFYLTFLILLNIFRPVIIVTRRLIPVKCFGVKLIGWSWPCCRNLLYLFCTTSSHRAACTSSLQLLLNRYNNNLLKVCWYTYKNFILDFK